MTTIVVFVLCVWTLLGGIAAADIFITKNYDFAQHGNLKTAIILLLCGPITWIILIFSLLMAFFINSAEHISKFIRRVLKIQ